MLGITLGYLDVTELCTYKGSELESSKRSTDNIVYGKFDCLLIQFQLGSVVGLEFVRVLGTTLGVTDRILPGTYLGIDKGSLECSTDGTKDENIDGLLVVSLLGSIDTRLLHASTETHEIGNNEGEKLGFPNGKYSAQNCIPGRTGDLCI